MIFKTKQFIVISFVEKGDNSSSYGRMASCERTEPIGEIVPSKPSYEFARPRREIGAVDYVAKTREFLADSIAEIRRLEKEIDRIREIVVRLERYVDEAGRRSGAILPEVPRNLSSSPPVRTPENPAPPFPSPPPPVPPGPAMARNEELRQGNEEGVGKNREGPLAGGILRPVGEVALELLMERPEGMSLDELYRIMVGRKDIPSSRDLKNAIRVALIRRKPQVVSPRRGWFRWERPED